MLRIASRLSIVLLHLSSEMEYGRKGHGAKREHLFHRFGLSVRFSSELELQQNQELVCADTGPKRTLVTSLRITSDVSHRTRVLPRQSSRKTVVYSPCQGSKENLGDSAFDNELVRSISRSFVVAQTHVPGRFSS